MREVMGVTQQKTGEPKMSQRSLRQAAVAGLLAGLVFVSMEMILVGTVGGGSPWGPPRMMGAIVLGTSVLPPPATFDAGIFTVGMLVHFALSAVLGVIFGFIARRMTVSTGALVGLGALFGLAVYLVNFYGFTTIFPWFEMARNWITIVSHLVFGAVLAWWLGRRQSHQEG
ncbi:hypothetical protein [Tsuneonella sp. SYSU-LHT278]|uniref:hypothetical protein n=1 Tax=Tsuneonella sediminis TaxID=3416089 RepID=UPI003F78EFB6